MPELLVPLAWLCAMLYSFFCQALVCEEYFVPALNVVIDRFKIPDDVAGATLMAMGTSSPELFCNIIALFATRTVDTGVGTIVGSDLFNMLCICGGSAIAAGSLSLQWTVLAREIIFYAVSIYALYWAMQDEIVTAFEAWALVLAYAFYAVVCCVQEPLIKLLSPAAAATRRFNRMGSGIIDLTGEPLDSDGLAGAGGSESTLVAPLLPGKEAEDTGKPFERRGVVRSRTQPMEIVPEAGKQALGIQSGFLLERAKVHLVGGHIWYRCFAVLADDTHHHLLRCDSAKEAQRRMAGKKIRKGSSWAHMPGRRESGADDEQLQTGAMHLMSEFLARDQSRDVDLKFVDDCRAVGDTEFDLLPCGALNPIVFQCDTSAERDLWVSKISEALEELKEFHDQAVVEMMSHTFANHLQHVKTDIWDEWPGRDGTISEKLEWLLTMPAKVAFMYTIPDVKEPEFEKYWWLTILMFLVWLPCLSYLMVTALNEVSDAWDLPPAIMALTVGAAGTSFPDFIASVVVAKEGQGNMAVSNAFGSNIFNIFIASGLPWAVFVSVCLLPGDKEAAFAADGSLGIYMPSKEIISGVVTLAISLVIFLLILVQQRFRVGQRIGWLFVCCWFAYVIWQVVALVAS